MIQLQRLEGFYWVAKTGGYARAARAFPYPITEPGVHQQVRRLETELGTALFERVGKDRVQLTAAGQALFQYVAPFLEGLRDVVQSIHGGTFAGTLRIHAAGLVLRQLLPAWLRRVQAKHPQLEIALSEVKVADVELLRRGEADLLVDHLAEVPGDIATQRVGTFHSHLVLPSDHPLSKRSRLELRQLRGEAFIAYNTDRRLRELQLGVLTKHGVTPARVHLADSADTILGFVAAGLGFSLVPSLSESGARIAGVAVHPLAVPEARFPIYAAWRKRGRDNPLLKAVLELAPAPSA